MSLIALIIVILYLALIGSLILGFDKVNEFTLKDVTPENRFSILIPFRNEAENLPALLQSISTLNYPKTHFEIIFIDDDSEDNSVTLINAFQKKSKLNISLIKNIRSSNSPKKDAITLAISQAKHPWIITTDADCVLPIYWLDSFDCFIQERQPDFIVAPVTLSHCNTFFKRFQLLEILSLQGATIGGFGINKPFLSNGANLGFKTDFFNTVNGYQGNNTIASGDDIFLLEKAINHPQTQVEYLKCDKAVVTTIPENSITSLFAQRVRWAAKTSNYRNIFGKLSGLIIFTMNAALLCYLLFAISGVVSYKVLVYVFIIKFCIDFLLIFKSARFFNQEHTLFSYVFGCFLYPFFSVFVAFTSVFKGYKWKGRAYRK